MSNTINNNNNDFYNSIFGANNYSYNSAQNSPLGGILGDYASIRNGSYGKLLKNYYAKQAKAEKSGNSEDIQKTKNELSKIKGEAKSLSEAATALYSDSSLFEKKEIKKTDENGNETKTVDYDRDAIKKKVSAFVDSYNAMVKSADKTEDTSVLRRTLNSVSRTKNNAKMLEKVGITVGKDNTLSIDEDKFKDASISDLKSLFSGRGSYAYGIATNASVVSNYTTTKLSDSKLYTSKATTYPENNKSNSLEDYI